MVMPAVIPEAPGEIDAAVALPTGEWWKRFFDGSEDAHIVCRPDGIAEQINPRAARQFKLNREIAEGSFCLFDALSPPADRKLCEALKRQRVHPDTLHSVVMLVDGVEHGLADIEIAPLGGDYTLITFKDAARRMRLESHVNRLVTAIDATPEVFFITDAEFRITFVNPAFHLVTGYSIETVLGRTDEFLRDASEQEKVRAYQEQVVQGREWIGELQNTRSDGSTYPVETTISPISDILGQFIGYVACERDITCRKQLESDLRVERDFIRSILHSLDGAIYSLDRQFCLTHANDGWRQMPAEHGGIRLAGPPQMGRPLLDYVPDEARRAELNFAFQEVLNTGGPQENRFHAPDGRHWLLRISPWIYDEQVRGLICTVADQSRYHELQSQLFQAQKMEIIGTLAAGVAHDFNNLLQAIRGNTSLVILQTEEDSELRYRAEQINLAAARAADITRQLLAFSRDSEEKKTVLDLNQVIQEAGQLARRTLRSNVDMQLVPASGPIPVKVDLTRANQALLNLCVNAQDAMPEGGTLTLANGVVRIAPEVAEWHGVTADLEFARCTVSDTGTGIPPEVLPRIFDAFFTTKETDKGTGLGLSIVKRVMQEAGGFADVETGLGRGTSFHLYFPIAQDQLGSVTPASHQPLAHGTGCVLVVDDLDLLRDFTQTFLEAAGLTVLVASSAPAAIELLEKESGTVDILFTDYNMPGMNGIELIEHVAARWPGIRPVLASGYLNGPTQNRLVALKARVLFKPYEMQEAANVIIGLLPEHRNNQV